MFSMTVDEENTKYDSRDNCNAIIETASNILINGCKETIIPNSVVSIDGFAFWSLDSLKSIEIPASVLSIKNDVFAYCYNLSSIKISASVSSIGNYAFWGCNNLLNIYMEGSNPPTLQGSNVFVKNVVNQYDSIFHHAILYVPIGAKEAYQNADGWSKFTHIVEKAPDADDIIDFADAGIKSICIKYWDTNGDGELSYGEAAAVTDLNMRFYYDHEIESFNELKYFTGLKNIRSSEFRHCVKLSHIELPNTIEHIGSFAFHNAPLYEMKIPESVKTIGDWAFQSSRNLSTLYIPKNVEEIGSCITSDTPILVFRVI